MEQRRIWLRILRHVGMGKARMEQKVMSSVADMLDQLEGIEDKAAVDMFEPLMVSESVDRFLRVSNFDL